MSNKTSFKNSIKISKTDLAQFFNPYLNSLRQTEGVLSSGRAVGQTRNLLQAFYSEMIKAASGVVVGLPRGRYQTQKLIHLLGLLKSQLSMSRLVVRLMDNPAHRRVRDALEGQVAQFSRILESVKHTPLPWVSRAAVRLHQFTYAHVLARAVKKTLVPYAFWQQMAHDIKATALNSWNWVVDELGILAWHLHVPLSPAEAYVPQAEVRLLVEYTINQQATAVPADARAGGESLCAAPDLTAPQQNFLQAFNAFALKPTPETWCQVEAAEKQLDLPAPRSEQPVSRPA